MSYQVLARKWRPQNFIELAGQDHVLQALVNALKQQRLHHAYLFTGTRGVGKTTIARIFAKCLNCETNGISPEPCGTCGSCVEIAEGRFVDLIEVDAASRTKVEDTRELLENVQYTPTRGRFKVYLIDEVHMLSTHSFNALLKTLEEPPAHVKFLLATTDPQKLPVTILSRCLQFNLKNMSPGRVVNYLEKVLTTEQLSYDEAGLWQIGQAANGSMRDALSLTDQAIAFGNGHISESDVTAMLGLVNQAQVVNLLETLVENDAAKLLGLVNELAEYQPDFVAICASLLDLLHRIAIEQQVPGALEDQLGDLASVKSIAQQVSSETIQLFYQTLLIGKRDLPLAHSVKAGFEMLLLRLIAFRPAVPVGVSSTPVISQHAEEVLLNKDASTSGSHTSKINESNQLSSDEIEINRELASVDLKTDEIQETTDSVIEDASTINSNVEGSVEVQAEINEAVNLASNIGSLPESIVEINTPEKEISDALSSAIAVEDNPKPDVEDVCDESDLKTNDLTDTQSKSMQANSNASEGDIGFDKSNAPPFVPDEPERKLDVNASNEKMADLSRLVQGDRHDSQIIEPKQEPVKEKSMPASNAALDNNVDVSSSNDLGSDDSDDEEEEEIELLDDVIHDRSAELVAVMQSEAIETTNIVDQTEDEPIEEKPIATNSLDIEFSKAEVIVQPALGIKAEPIAHFSELTMQMWWLIAPRLPLTGLVQNILMNSCMLEAGEQGVKLEVPLEYGHMLNQVRYEQIQSAIGHYFNDAVPLIIDTVADVSGVTAEEFAASKRAQAMQEAIDHLNAHPIVMALSSTMGGQLIYDSVKIKA